jgi:arylsulfatase A-like enzyme
MRDAGPFALIVLAALLSCGTAAIAEAPKPNVIVILTDDLGWGDLSCYPKGPAWGHEAFVATPHLDQLAANGVRFTDAYATCMVCSPSRAALLSGRYQQRLGWYGFVEAVLATSPAP